MKFSAFNVDFSSLSRDLLGSRTPAQAGVKDSYLPPPKVVILPQLSREAWKRLQIATYMLLIITSTGDRLFGFINIDYLERPWTPQKRFFSEFVAQFCAATRISRVNCAKMAGDRPRQPAFEIFSMECRFYQSKSGLFRFKEACARGCQREVPL